MKLRRSDFEAALRTSASLRLFLRFQRKLAEPLEDEQELRTLLRMEQRRDPPRRSVLKKLHSAYCEARRKNEWHEIEKLFR